MSYRLEDDLLGYTQTESGKFEIGSLSSHAVLSEVRAMKQKNNGYEEIGYGDLYVDGYNKAIDDVLEKLCSLCKDYAPLSSHAVLDDVRELIKYSDAMVKILLYDDKIFHRDEMINWQKQIEKVRANIV